MTRMHVGLGSLTIVAFLALLGAGLLIDSTPYRLRLLPDSGAGVAMAAAQPGEPHPPTQPEPPKVLPANVSRATAFVASMLFFTPINVAFLTLLAGLLGGITSQITFTAAAPESLTDIQKSFRTENPLASMTRGFVVYLAFIAGVYVATSQPFANVTADQYLRLAGTLSFFAFVVGYDPTKFQDWLGKVGAPGKA